MPDNEIEYPFPRDLVFKALVEVAKGVSKSIYESSDELVGRVTITTKAGLLSWPVKVVFTLTEPSQNKTHLKKSINPNSSGGVTWARGITEIVQRDSKTPDKGNSFESAKTAEATSEILDALSIKLALIKALMPPELPKEKDCPFCGETIKIQAVKCRFCSSILPLPSAPPPASKLETFHKPIAPKFLKLEAGNIYFECSLCSQQIAAEESSGGMEIKCPECGEKQPVPIVPTQKPQARAVSVLPQSPQIAPQQPAQAQSIGNSNTTVNERPNYTTQASQFTPQKNNYLDENKTYQQKLKQIGLLPDDDSIALSPQPVKSISPKFLKLESGSIHFECGGCGQKIAIDESGGGMEIACPKCNKAQIIPTS